MDNGDFSEIRQILRDIAITHDQHAKMLLLHSEMMVAHDERMAEFDQRMDKLGRHLEVLSGICDDLIRGKQDRKKR